MRNQEQIAVNDLNKNANGGTELTTRRLFDLLEPEELDGVQIITSRVRELEADKLRIYHLHDLPNDSEASHLVNPESRDRFDKLVFSSHWQYQQFQNFLGVPFDTHSAVIETGVDPLAFAVKADPQTNPIRLIYHSTPHRGLEILVPVFEALQKKYSNIELHVYSSFKLYGWEERDKPYQELFARCENNPQIKYFGAQPNDVVRQALQEAHIFAFPSIWPETSCRCLIEAMMAGCVCIHPNLAALTDTSGGMTTWYNGTSNINDHAAIFANTLDGIISRLMVPDQFARFIRHLQLVSHVANGRFGWPNVIHSWKGLIASLKAQNV